MLWTAVEMGRVGEGGSARTRARVLDSWGMSHVNWAYLEKYIIQNNFPISESLNSVDYTELVAFVGDRRQELAKRNTFTEMVSVVLVCIAQRGGSRSCTTHWLWHVACMHTLTSHWIRKSENTMKLNEFSLALVALWVTFVPHFRS